MNKSQIGKHLCIILLLISTSPLMAPVAADTSSLTECESRCQPLSGEERYRCIKTCLSSKRKSEPVHEKKETGTFQECKESCSSLKGLEGIRCIRTCMENRRSEAPARENPGKEKPAAVSSCESRCKILNGDLKEKCLARCKKEKYGEYRDPLRFKK
ncbi:MAG TPA: hypothetical protein PK307_11020 [Spirochaetota bacterium]|nr:hypothetical protein [Spirochaetota bacterium]HPG50474.1 hypothetical protein [Spirochaetota bacterium]HPN13134.1 hypothetical protein [Spirochaetota bacterium]HQL82727.1 hypothetical protein [Spirochaetota bacterium]